MTREDLLALADRANNSPGRETACTDLVVVADCYHCKVPFLCDPGTAAKGPEAVWCFRKACRSELRRRQNVRNRSK